MCFLYNSLDSLSLLRNVNALFYYRDHSIECLRELTNCILYPLWCLHSMRDAVTLLEFCVDVGNSRFVRCNTSAFPIDLCSWEFSSIRCVCRIWVLSFYVLGSCDKVHRPALKSSNIFVNAWQLGHQNQIS